MTTALIIGVGTPFLNPVSTIESIGSTKQRGTVIVILSHDQKLFIRLVVSVNLPNYSSYGDVSKKIHCPMDHVYFFSSTDLTDMYMKLTGDVLEIQSEHGCSFSGGSFSLFQLLSTHTQSVQSSGQGDWLIKLIENMV